MRGKIVKIVHHYARASGIAEGAAKKLWLGTPGPKRAKLREKMQKEISDKE